MSRLLRYTSFTVIVICIANIIFRSVLAEFDTDLPWHIRMGLDVLDGHPILKDIHSHSYFGQSLKSSYLLFQLFVASAYKLLGYHGLVVTKLTILLLGLMFVVRFAMDMKLEFPAIALAVAFYTYGTTLRFGLRADILMYAMIPLHIYLLKRLSNQWSYSIFAGYCLSFLFWINWQTFGALLGFVYLGCVIGEQVVRFVLKQKPEFRWAHLLYMMGAFVGLGFLNPHFDHPLLHYFHYDDTRWSTLPSEMQKIPFSQFDPVFYVYLFFILISSYTPVRQFRLAPSVFLLVLVKGAFDAVRMVSSSLGIGALSFAQITSLTFRSSRWGQAILLVCALFISGFSFHESGQKYRGLIDLEDFDILSTGRGLLEQFSHPELVKGRAVNEIAIGGYIMLYLPNLLVSHDTRSNVLYSFEDTVSLQTLITDRTQFQNYVREHNIDHVVGVQKSDSPNIFRWTSMDDSFYPLAFDDYYFIYSRVQGSQALHHALWNPNCLDKLKAEDLARDRQKLGALLDSESLTMITLEYLQNAIQNGIDESVVPPSDLSRRFIARKLIQQGRLQDAETVLSLISNSNLNDTLTLVHLAFELNKFERAKQLISYTMKFAELSPVEKSIVESLKQKIEKYKSQIKLFRDPGEWLKEVEQFSKQWSC